MLVFCCDRSNGFFVSFFVVFPNLRCFCSRVNPVLRYTFKDLTVASYFMRPNLYDVIIIGGASSGLSAALVLARSLRRVLVIDGGEPSNRFAVRSHNFLTHDGEIPADIGKAAREQVEAYDNVSIVSEKALEAEDTVDGFRFTVESGNTFTGRKVLFASGLNYELADLKGYAACWGVSALHCPYCHGYEFRNQPTGILFEDQFSRHYLDLIYHLSADLVVFTNGGNSLNEARRAMLEAKNIKVYEEQIAELKHERGELNHVVLASGTAVPLRAFYSLRPTLYRNHLAEDLGCELGKGGYVKRVEKYETTVKGAYVCGDVAGGTRSIAVAVASGNEAGIAIHEALLIEDA